MSFSENHVSEDSFVSLETSYYNQIFLNRENEFVHNPYNHELRECAAIERGDEEDLKEILSETYTGRYGTLADDPLRHEINLGIVVVTIASRSAIRGGLRYEAAFTLSDSYIRQMEKCKDPEAVKKLYVAAEFHYARLVHQLKNPEISRNFSEDQIPNRHIEHCKDYIFSHLHGKLTVQEIADHIGLEPNYLSALFRKKEGITLKQYILNQKLDLVQKMLTYSPYSYIEIATYLGFSSQSHMGAEFKKATGMTPRQYREKYQKEDFLAENN